MSCQTCQQPLCTVCNGCHHCVGTPEDAYLLCLGVPQDAIPMKATKAKPCPVCKQAPRVYFLCDGGIAMRCPGGEGIPPSGHRHVRLTPAELTDGMSGGTTGTLMLGSLLLQRWKVAAVAT